MNLFDMFKDKATELLQGATGKVSELTGLPLGDVVDQAGQGDATVTGTEHPTTAGAPALIGSETGWAWLPESFLPVSHFGAERHRRIEATVSANVR